MFYREFSTDDVADWIEDAANACLTDYDDDVPMHMRISDQVDNNIAYAANAIAIIAYYDVFAAVRGDFSCYEDSPAARFEQDVRNRVDELCEEQGIAIPE